MYLAPLVLALLKTMVDHDHAAFISFLAEEAIFISTTAFFSAEEEVAAS